MGARLPFCRISRPWWVRKEANRIFKPSPNFLRILVKASFYYTQNSFKNSIWSKTFNWMVLKSQKWKKSKDASSKASLYNRPKPNIWAVVSNTAFSTNKKSSLNNLGRSLSFAKNYRSKNGIWLNFIRLLNKRKISIITSRRWIGSRLSSMMVSLSIAGIWWSQIPVSCFTWTIHNLVLNLVTNQKILSQVSSTQK